MFIENLCQLEINKATLKFKKKKHLKQENNYI